jgi:hypothetical protein
MLVDLGFGSVASAAAMLAIHDGAELPAEARAPFLAWERPEPRAWALLEGGHLVPCYVKARTARERWRSALVELERLRMRRQQAVKFGVISMPDATRDHGSAMWMAAGTGTRSPHLVYRDGRREGRTVCGAASKASWSPVIPAELVKCRTCERNAAKRSLTIVEPEPGA